jgi:hypothetical protein
VAVCRFKQAATRRSELMYDNSEVSCRLPIYQPMQGE